MPLDYLQQEFVGRTLQSFVSAIIEREGKLSPLARYDYSELGILLIAVTLLNLFIPILIVWFIQKSKLKTFE